MMRFHSPFSLVSIVEMVLVNPCGPHQFLMCLGLVQTSHTSSTGAAKRREIVSWRSAFTLCCSFAIIFLFNLYSMQVFFQGVELGGPELTILFYPLRHLIKFFQLGFAKSFTALLSYFDDAAFGKNFNVF